MKTDIAAIFLNKKKTWMNEHICNGMFARKFSNLSYSLTSLNVIYYSNKAHSQTDFGKVSVQKKTRLAWTLIEDMLFIMVTQP